MTDQKLFIQTLKNEIPIFERVFLALPNKPIDWRAHPKNKSAMELSLSMLGEAEGFPTFLKTGEIDISEPMKSKADDMKKISHDFRKLLEEGLDMIFKMDEDDWDSPSEMKMKSKSMWKSTKGGMAWGFLIDLIHHRGQLSTYIRPLGGKVPSIYGPSGDDTGGM